MIRGIDTCFVCGEGVLHKKIDRAHIHLPWGKKVVVSMEYSVCSECGIETQNMIETESNTRSMRNLFNQVRRKSLVV